MSVLFMGGELSALIPSDSTVIETTATTYSNYDTAFARAAIGPYQGTKYAEGHTASGQTDVWLHFDMVVGGSVLGTCTRFTWANSSGTDYVRLRHAANADTVSVEYWNGSAWTTAGAQISLSLSHPNRQTIDIHVVCNSASGSIKLYVGGTLRIDSGTIDLSGCTNLKTFRFFGGTAGAASDATYVSQVAAADESTIGCRLITCYPSGVGATSGFTGAYTDVDEAVLSDADFILSGTANQVSTFAQTGPAITGYSVRAVAVSARAKKGTGGPQNLQLALRSAGTNYFGSSQALDAGYAGYQEIWATDPATSAAWVNTAISSLQPGVKSIT